MSRVFAGLCLLAIALVAQMAVSGQAQAADATKPAIPFVYIAEPQYPAAAKSKHSEGTAVVLLTVAADASLVTSKLIISSGEDVLDQAAIDAAQQSKFPAMLIGGKPVSSNFVLEYRFYFEAGNGLTAAQLRDSGLTPK